MLSPCPSVQSPISVSYWESPVSQFSCDISCVEASVCMKQVISVWYSEIHLVSTSSSLDYICFNPFPASTDIMVILVCDQLTFAVGWACPLYTFSWSQDSCIDLSLGPSFFFLCFPSPHKCLPVLLCVVGMWKHHHLGFNKWLQSSTQQRSVAAQGHNLNSLPPTQSYSMLSSELSEMSLRSVLQPFLQIIKTLFPGIAGLWEMACFNWISLCL